MNEQPVTIVTGAGRGIGREAARALARDGSHLALVARTESDLKSLQREVGESIIFPADVGNPGRVDQIVAGTVQHFGRVDAIVHCAGIAPMLSVEAITNEQWRATIDTNLSSAFFLARSAWPIFRKQGGGAIVNISSLAAVGPFPGFAAYGAAKAGLNLLGLALARKGAPINVRVHTLALGAVETQMFRNIRTVEQFGRDKTLDPADVAKVIVQCVCGDLRHTSGEVITLRRTV